MILKLILIFVSSAILSQAQIYAQNSKIVNLENKLKEAKSDSTKAVILNDLSWEYINVDPSKGFPLIDEAIDVCKTNNFIKLKSSCYNTKANLFEVTGDLIQAENHYKKSIEEKKKINDAKGIATVYSNLSKIYRRQSKYEEGISYLLKSIAIQDSLKNYYGLGLAYNNLGAIYKDLGDDKISKTYHLKALENRILAKDSLGIAYSYVNIGGNYNDLGEYKNGIKYLLNGLAVLERKKDYPAMMLTLSNISSTYLKIKNFTLAKKYNDRALNLSLEKNNSNHLASIYQVKAEILMENKNYSKSLENLQLALNASKQHKQNFLQIEITANIGACLYHLKDYKKAKKILNEAIVSANEYELKSIEFKSLCKLIEILILDDELQIANGHLKRAAFLAKKLDSKKNYLTYYRTAINLAKATKNEGLLLKSYDTYFLYRDSVMPENIHSSMSEASTKYETEKKEREIQLLYQQKKIKNLELKEQAFIIEKRNLFLYSILILFCFSSIFVFFMFRKEKLLAQKKKILAIKTTEEIERTRIAKDLHDDLGSGLSKIRFLTEHFDRNLTEDEFSKKIKAINQTSYNLVDNMRDLIWVLNPENNTLDNLFVRVREYISDYFDESNLEYKIEIPRNISSESISNEFSRNVFSVIKEALQNIVKHAEATKVNFEVIQNLTSFEINIRDNGIGLSDEKNKIGNGLKNMKSRIEKLGGEIEFMNENGTIIKIKFPNTSFQAKNGTFV